MFNHYMSKFFGGFSLISNAWATNCTYIFSGVSLIACISYSNDPILTKIWPRGYSFLKELCSKEVWAGLKLFSRLAVAGMLMTCFEEWTNQGLEFMAGLLGVT
jgi:hypothetical protein